MKSKSVSKFRYLLNTACLLASAALCIVPANVALAQKLPTSSPASAADRNTVAIFAARAKAYVKLRNRVESKLQKLSKDSTPEQIASHKKAFEEGVRTARVGAKPGDIFTTGAGEYLRRMIRNEFKGQDRGEVKEAILDAETSGVPLKVNYPYPETKEVSAIPPTLLLRLPELPKELNYRFVRRHMLLIDKENGLILDYMLNALP
ncbi:MAG TPA: hypothetical protein VNO50_14340 [Pyrinomonadaceae bacterium]|nr:hypothetical protein [Pyrinomonadaceae bacterium]